MKVTIYDYNRYPHEVEVPDGTTEIAGVVISGDEVLVYPVYADPMWMHRAGDFLDGGFCRILDDGVWKDKPGYDG